MLAHESHALVNIKTCCSTGGGQSWQFFKKKSAITNDIRVALRIRKVPALDAEHSAHRNESQYSAAAANATHAASLAFVERVNEGHKAAQYNRAAECPCAKARAVLRLQMDEMRVKRSAKYMLANLR